MPHFNNELTDEQKNKINELKNTFQPLVYESPFIKKEYKQTVVFDFDGVIHSYISGWKGIDNIPDPPVNGIREAIYNIRKEYKVVIVSTRCADKYGKMAMEEWLREHEIYVDDIVTEKPPAIVYIDDRAITFDGKSELLLEKIKSFVPWNKK